MPDIKTVGRDNGQQEAQGTDRLSAALNSGSQQRLSTAAQETALQTDALTKTGCKRIYEDAVSGTKAERLGSMSDEYKYARKNASYETGIASAGFPAACPYSIEQVLADDWLPS